MNRTRKKGLKYPPKHSLGLFARNIGKARKGILRSNEATWPSNVAPGLTRVGAQQNDTPLESLEEKELLDMKKDVLIGKGGGGGSNALKNPNNPRSGIKRVKHVLGKEKGEKKGWGKCCVPKGLLPSAPIKSGAFLWSSRKLGPSGGGG